MKVRQDSWTEEDDLLLAETVLRHVREGSTQLNAFEEVGDQLNRTASACGFRWNAVVREQYEKALELSKKQRKQRLRNIGLGKPAKKQLLYSPPFSTLPETSNMAFPTIPPTSFPKKSSFGTTSGTSLNASLSIDDVVQFLSTMNGSQHSAMILKHENDALHLENEKLMRQNEKLEEQVHKLQKDSMTIEEDYQTLMQIMNRARKLVLFDEEERPSTKFRMDRNGNLEKLAE
ncbi:RsfA family transcriptional regulator [Bacillus sp. DJP31]|uniref:RsfA family transcriptional regulator n=1 Tax=Bacillus sp. DJP31 TaxID=3409789 RepID=UPI003BB78727